MKRLEPLDLPPRLARVADAVRRVIFDTVPGVEEKIYKGRQAAGYRDRQMGVFLGLFLHQGKLHLDFPHGVRLEKPERLLTDGRYVSYAPGARVSVAPLKRILHGALLTRLT